MVSPFIVLVLLPRKPARRHPVRAVGLGWFRRLRSRAGYGAFPIHYARRCCNRYPIGQLQNPNSNRWCSAVSRIPFQSRGLSAFHWFGSLDTGTLVQPLRVSHKFSLCYPFGLLVGISAVVSRRQSRPLCLALFAQVRISPPHSLSQNPTQPVVGLFCVSLAPGKMLALWYWFVALLLPCFPNFQKHFKGLWFWRLLIITNLIDRDSIKTFSAYCFLCGVSVGFSGCHIDTHTPLSPFYFDT